jgi:mannose-1-phosphate guanylyltransferase
MMTYALILAGGRGERFWPLSRRSMPKQLQPIVGERSMLEETVNRISPLTRRDRILIVTTRLLKKRITALFRDFPPENLLFEPMGKNTALAIGYAAICLQVRHPRAKMVVLPADHHIQDGPKFLNAVKVALDVAQSKLLVTFGIIPDRPETEYGYIRLGKVIHSEDDVEVYSARAFTEKPNRKRARAFLDSGNYLWNSGIFVWRVDTILEAMREQMPQLHERLMRFRDSEERADGVMSLNRLYKESDSISIDYGVMENAFNVAVVKADFRWDDVGSWSALHRLKAKDEAGNIVVGEHLGEDTRESIIFSGSGLVGTLGVSDLIIVRTENVTLVAKKSRYADVRRLVDKLYENEDLKKYA